MLVPGIVILSNNLVEHPELVAERIVRFAEAVDPENVVASTDCGLGGPGPPPAGLGEAESLVEGAELATRRLF